MVKEHLLLIILCKQPQMEEKKVWRDLCSKTQESKRQQKRRDRQNSVCSILALQGIVAATKKASRTYSDSGRCRNQAYAEGIITILSLSKDRDMCLSRALKQRP